MTVDDLLVKLNQFDPKALVMLRNTEPEAFYYPNFQVIKFSGQVEDFAIFSTQSPFVRIPFNVVEAGWRPSDSAN